MHILRHKTPIRELPLRIDWESEGIPNAHAQVVDGRLECNGSNVTTREVGYDRLIAVGDVRWRDYEVLVPISVHGMEPRAYASRSVHTGVGVVLRWKGHSNWNGDLETSRQPRSAPVPYGAIGWWTTWADGSEHLNFFDVDLRPVGIVPRSLELNRFYLFRVRVTTPEVGRSIYGLKVWPDDEDEPVARDVTMRSPVNGMDSGGLLLAAHETAASFGPVEIRPPADD